jgi:cytochrome c peroxidase
MQFFLMVLFFVSFGCSDHELPTTKLARLDTSMIEKPDVAKVELGKHLFFDKRLSGNQNTSCAQCHQPNLGWQDERGLCQGYDGTENFRNCPTIVNSVFYKKLFWDGRSQSLQHQAVSAATSPVEGNLDLIELEERLKVVPEYVKMFKAAYGVEEISEKKVWDAVAAFEKTIIQDDTPFDRFMDGNLSALTESQKRGLRLFTGKANCIACHNGQLLSDENFYNLGVPNPPDWVEVPQAQITFRFAQKGKGVGEESFYKKLKIDLGRYYVTFDKNDLGTFRTPSLRYLKYTAPYMHNGVFATLEEVVEFFNKGGGPDLVNQQLSILTKSNKLKPLGLSESEKVDLVDFLKSLSGEQIVISPPNIPEINNN